MKEENAKLKGEVASLQIEVSRLQSKVEDIEYKLSEALYRTKEKEGHYAQEQKVRNEWEVAYQALKNEYEDEDGNLQGSFVNLYIEEFVKYDKCKNLYARLNYNTIRTVF